ncbi:MAG: hypothetical protein K8F91_12400 [Candidatus Obscuribacterales bacterium]|nr:hypothetical protein [Candidatus Obscuribacterales bacterium]
MTTLSEPHFLGHIVYHVVADPRRPSNLLMAATANQNQVDLHTKSVRELLVELDTRYPGIRFGMIDEHNGINQHIKIFVDSELIDTIDFDLEGVSVVHMVSALSGG